MINFKNVTRILIAPVLIAGGFLLFNVTGANAACNSPGKCVSTGICSGNNGTTLPGSSCSKSGEICCVYQQQSYCEAFKLISNSACTAKAGLQEVPDAPDAKCPDNFSTDGCSNKPKTGSGVVLCCYDLKISSSGKECEPKTKQDDKMYLCLTKDACANAEGKEVVTKSTVSECAGGNQNEVCCETRTRTGTPATATKPKAKTYALTNPLGQVSLSGIAKNVINTFLGIVGALALLVFVYAGVTYLIAGGNSSQVDKAKATMKYAIIGIFIIMFSYVLTDSFISLWTQDLTSSLSTDPAVGELETQAQQEVTDIKSQQQEAEKAEEEAKAKAKTDKTNICGDTANTQGYSCIEKSGVTEGSAPGEYTCISGYCMAPGSSGIYCCKENQ